jgi:hypothetical protein
MVEAQGCPKQRRQGGAECHWWQSTKMRQPEGSEDLRGPAKLHPTLVEAVRGQKMDLLSPGELGAGRKPWGGGVVRAPGTESAADQASTKRAPWGSAWVVRPQGFSKTSRLELGLCAVLGGVPEDVKSPKSSIPAVSESTVGHSGVF